MGPNIFRCFCTLVLAIVPTQSSLASPLNFKLLPLVPPGAEIVAGFQERHEPGPTGRLLLTTHNNRLDLDDWIALTGIDSSRAFDEVIEVATSSGGFELRDHLLLVAGKFDRQRIFRAAEQNGAAHLSFLGETAFLIKPYSREQGDMLDTRWLIILNDQTAIFGTPRIVQQALRRFESHSLPDPSLMEQLGRFHPDVTCWNLLSKSSRLRTGINFAQRHGPWSRLFEDTGLVMIAAHFGSSIRVDLLLDAEQDRGEDFLAQKEEFFLQAFVGDVSSEVASGQVASGQDTLTPKQPRLRDVLIKPDRVEASLVLSHREFLAWREREISHNQAFRVVRGTPGD